MAYTTLAQLTTVNDKNANDFGVSDLYDDAPLLKVLSATVASDGNRHLYIKQTGASGADFRAVNTGIVNAGPTESEVTVTMKLLDGSFPVDKALADGYIKGPEAYIQRYARMALRATLFKAEQQVVGGTVGGSSSGFSGFADAITSKTAAMAIDAAGTTTSTGSSIYLVRHNDLGTDVQAVIGQNGSISVGQSVEQAIVDASGYPYTAYWTPIHAWMALQVGSSISFARICNITADSGKTASDALISRALALFPASRQPNLIVMGRRSLQQLQASRTATSATGTPAPIPQDSFNIPIVVTDAIGSTETLLS